MSRFSSEALEGELKKAHPDADYSPTDPSAPLVSRLAAAGGGGDRCKTATVLWEDAFGRWRWSSNFMLILAGGTAAVLVVTLVVALVQSNAVAAIVGAVGTVGWS